MKVCRVGRQDFCVLERTGSLPAIATTETETHLNICSGGRKNKKTK